MAKKLWTLIRVSALYVAAASVIAITAASGAEKVVIGLSQPNLGWPYIAAYTKAFQDAAAKKGNVDVIALSGEGDIAKQSRDMDSLIAKKVNIILVCSPMVKQSFPD
jgi:ribose transport system substrate-binding protein